MSHGGEAAVAGSSQLLSTAVSSMASELAAVEAKLNRRDEELAARREWCHSTDRV